MGSFHLNFSSSVTIFNFVCCESSESFPSVEDESPEVEVWFRLLLLPYFFFLAGCNVTSGETSLEELLSEEYSLFILFFLLFRCSFEIRLEEDSCLFLAEDFLSSLLCSSRLTSGGFFSLSLAILTYVSCISWLFILFGLQRQTYYINSQDDCRHRSNQTDLSRSELLPL